MRLAAGAPPNLWDYFVKTAAQLSWYIPTQALHNKTPYEAMQGRKPNLSHLCEIGCRAFVLIQHKTNPKIYECSLKCILIGYSPNSKAYICYHKPSHRVITSFHVRFIES
ncbi:hypothetical protein K435DRAFT_695935, partial [Dendrothele bispora CBS 962.96]